MLPNVVQESPIAPADSTVADAVTAGSSEPVSIEPASIEPTSIEPASIEQFLSDIGARAFRFAEFGLRQREDALDAVQDAMMRMLGYRERPAAEWTPLFWSILRRRIVDLQRRRTFRLSWFSSPAINVDDQTVDWVDEGPGPARTHEGREAYTRVAMALARLPRRQREAFTLRVLEELDVASTARAMDCSEGSVKTHLSRARESLQRQLEGFR